LLRNLKRLASYSLHALRTKESFPSIFTSEPPSAQLAVDLFKDDWAAQLPIEGLRTGNRPDLFDDPRIQWYLDRLAPHGGIAGKSVLELGPLEGAHSSMLEKKGAGSVLGIESNARAFLKCLTVKELLDLKNCHFQYGDFVKYLGQPGPQFDLGIACGVFYHLRSPHDVLVALRKKVTGPVFLWTHYWSASIQTEYPHLWKNFTGSRTVNLTNGEKADLYRHEYGETVFFKGFLGGNARYSEWMEKDSMFRSITAAGWRVDAQMDASNSAGPALSAVLVPV